MIRENPGGIAIRSGETETDITKSKTLMTIGAKKITLDAEELFAKGRQGQTGTAQFSNGTNLRFVNGILVGGTTKEGAF